MNSMRGGQYCEIIWAGPLDPTNISAPLLATVSWNGTMGTCPSNPGFYNVTESDVRAVHGRQADIIVWNGMRQWTLDLIHSSTDRSSNRMSDDINTTTDDEFFEYGTDIFPDGSGLLMRKAATLSINPGAVRMGQGGGYVPNFVQRNVTAVWKAGTTVLRANGAQLYRRVCDAILFHWTPGNLFRY